MLRAERLALQESRGRVGAFRVRLAALDNAAKETGSWDADRTAVNARAALRDDTTIAYLGEWDEEATGISLPIFNEAGILQVSLHEHLRRAHARRRAPPPASPSASSRRASGPTPAWCPPTTSRPPRSRR